MGINTLVDIVKAIENKAIERNELNDDPLAPKMPLIKEVKESLDCEMMAQAKREQQKRKASITKRNKHMQQHLCEDYSVCKCLRYHQNSANKPLAYLCTGK